MIICIEGCIGAGKTSLAGKLASALGVPAVYEEFENNPFLKDFYTTPDVFAFHVQSTFLCLQSKQFIQAVQNERNGLVVTDFHPVKSKVFSDIVIKTAQERVLIQQIYDNLFRSIDPNVLIVYLKVSTATALQRIRKRNDIFTTDIPMDYIENLVQMYEKHFSNYPHPLLTIDADELDFMEHENDWQFVLQQVMHQLQ